jgi:DNA-binding response OmpR family regulator
MPTERRAPAIEPRTDRHVAVVDAGGSTAPSMVEALARELGPIPVHGPGVLAEPALPGAVYVWDVPAGLPAAQFSAIVGWASAAAPMPGLVGCAADGNRDDVERALAEGFDDFLIGPVGWRELAVRLRAIARRIRWTGVGPPGRLRHAGFVLDLDGHELWVEGRAVALTETERQVMRALIGAGGRTLSRAALLDAAWGGADLEVGERAVDNVILRLRRKLPRPDAIETVRGVGFRLALG